MDISKESLLWFYDDTNDNNDYDDDYKYNDQWSFDNLPIQCVDDVVS